MRPRPAALSSDGLLRLGGNREVGDDRQMIGAEIGADPVRENPNIRAHQNMINEQAYEG